MKKLLFLSLLLCFGCSRCCDYFCNCPPPPTRISNAPHVPNEIILDAQDLGANYNALKDYLELKGFKKADSCNCSHSLELWRNPQAVNVIGEITDAKAKPGTVGGNGWRLSPNFRIGNDEKITPDTLRDDSVPRKPIGKPVRIVIVDTGVDPANNFLTLLWRKSQITSRTSSCADEKEYGLNVPMPGNEPLDGQGHGTMVNGIINGIPKQNTGNQSGIAFEQINAKFTTGNDNTGTLFKAVCGLYYGLDKGGQVFNLSWGYAGGEAPELIKSFLETAKTQNVIVVAGAGNDHKNNDSIPFWPASFSNTYNFVISVGGYNDANFTGYTQATPLLYNNSNYGQTVNVFAPAVDVRTVGMGSNRFAKNSGTSMATAYVTRVAAIARGKNLLWSAQYIKDSLIIKNSPIKTSTDGKTVRVFHAQTIINAL